MGKKVIYSDDSTETVITSPVKHGKSDSNKSVTPKMQKEMKKVVKRNDSQPSAQKTKIKDTEKTTGEKKKRKIKDVEKTDGEEKKKKVSRKKKPWENYGVPTEETTKDNSDLVSSIADFWKKLQQEGPGEDEPDEDEKDLNFKEKRPVERRRKTKKKGEEKEEDEKDDEKEEEEEEEEETNFDLRAGVPGRKPKESRSQQHIATTMKNFGPTPIVAENGYWGTPTSTLNWCEEDYAVTFFVAETINTLTNLWAITCIYPLFCIWSNGWPKRYLVLWLSLCCVAFGSWMCEWHNLLSAALTYVSVHMTLQWQWQVLGDEIPMLLVRLNPQAVAASMFVTMEVTPVSQPAVKRKKSLIWGIGISAMTLAVIVTYLYTGMAEFHQAAFGIMVWVTFLRGLYLFKKVIPSDVHDLAIREKRSAILKMDLWGAVIMNLAFALWNIDNHFCHQIIQLRSYLGQPFATLLQLHGWWHIGTGVGTYMLVTASMMLSLMISDDHHRYELQWYMGILPRIAPSQQYLKRTV
ncbi:hypothetical protein PROFUN_14058 [Planoprotostelium fungivorum]|uniref:Alkaline ceramidase 3 n=1 Tax=Planoprotostelium fungivorum TaxID=1890364 RepID=A0A2P6N258_9EUKA|nr:hypothetical protein PROFUN_15688 [Planoprotostelium fungivorum]PRP78020.1 hypothetical protein PROFUN_14058 [Planoprotostelium fungivorum]